MKSVNLRKTWRAYHNLVENKQKKMRRNTWNNMQNKTDPSETEIDN